MIISFGWTTPALLAGQKTVTRRAWAASHAAKFKAGMIIDAWNTSPRNVAKDPHRVATIRLTQDPTLEYYDAAPPEDWHREGFEYLEALDLRVAGARPRDFWASWQRSDEQCYVVRFEVVEIVSKPT